MKTLSENLTKRTIQVEYVHCSKKRKWNWWMGKYVDELVIEIWDDFPQLNEYRETENLSRLNNMDLSPHRTQV